MNDTRSVQLFGAREAKRATEKRITTHAGELRWDACVGVVYDVRDRRLKASLQRSINARIRAGQYYVAAAVRTAGRVSGLRFDRIDASVPEILRCVTADAELWRKDHAGIRLTAVYEDGERRAAA